MSAFDFVVAYGSHPGVINFSGGRSANCCWNTVDDAVRGAYNSGFPVVIAAGNDSTDSCNWTPGRIAEAITVGATKSGDFRASFSNYGGCVKLFAPGESVNAAALNGYTDLERDFVCRAIHDRHDCTHVTRTAWLDALQLSLMTDRYSSIVGIGNAGANNPNHLLYSPHTEISGPPQGPQPFSCGYAGNATWSTAAWGGDGNYSYTWIIDYDDSMQDDEYLSTTGNTLTWYINATGEASGSPRAL